MKIRFAIAICSLFFHGSVGLAHAQADWRKQWETTIDAGKKEGEVAIYGPHNPAYQQVWSLFQKVIRK